MMADAECPETLGRLVHRAANILNMVWGRLFAPPEENLADLIKDCQDVLAAMEKAREEEYEARRARINERYRRMAAGMGDEPGTAPAN